MDRTQQKFRIVERKNDRWQFRGGVYTWMEGYAEQKKNGGLLRPVAAANKMVMEWNDKDGKCKNPPTNSPFALPLKDMAEAQIESILRQYTAHTGIKVKSVFFGHEGGEIEITLED